VANDKGDGEDLFEDLDKFFAPIRDVDWDEPEEPTERAPQESHVEVRSEESPETTQELLTTDVASGGSEEGTVEGQPDDAWDDSDALEPIDDILGEPPAPDDADGSDVVVVDAGGSSDVVGAGGSEGDVFEPDEASTLEGEPSEEDLEAAAAHFSDSLSGDSSYATEPVDALGGSEVGDLLSDLGAAPSASSEDVEADLLSDLHDPDAPPRTVVVGGEGISGPSWQEPASVEVGADLDRRGPQSGERDVPAAFMTGVLLAGVALAALWAGPAAFAVVAGIAVLVAQGELFGVMVKAHNQPATLVGLVAGVLMMAGAYFRGEAATPAMFALGVMATFLWFMTVPAEHRTNVTRNIGMTVLNMAWIPLLGGYLIATLKLDDGKALVFAIILLTFLFDTAAFLIGSVSGGGWFQRPLAPNVSPKKSWEGLLGGTFATVVASGAFVTSFVGPFENRRIDALLLGLVVAIAATLGDLAESVVKRDVGVKDMGTVLPGHGGVLDRIDSLLFVAPATFLLFRVIFT
jgi:phosphatidate cytidylyltransferase